MIDFNPSQFYDLIAAFFLPLTRILGIFSAAPFFGHRSIPVMVRVSFGFALTLVVMPVLPEIRPVDPVSLDGFALMIKEFLIGIAISYCMLIIFVGIEMAGEIISMTMGLGFASFFDPQTMGRNFAVSQLATLIAILLFLGNDLHLVFLETVINSFTSLPVDKMPSGVLSLEKIQYFGKTLFEIGTHLSLPITTIILITNLAFGVLNKAAPQLNLFSVGFPASLLVGYISMLYILAYWDDALLDYLSLGLKRLQDIF